MYQIIRSGKLYSLETGNHLITFCVHVFFSFYGKWPVRDSTRLSLQDAPWNRRSRYHPLERAFNPMIDDEERRFGHKSIRLSPFNLMSRVTVVRGWTAPVVTRIDTWLDVFICDFPIEKTVKFENNHKIWKLSWYVHLLLFWENIQ